jgi:hypothetical protein
MAIEPRLSRPHQRHEDGHHEDHAGREAPRHVSGSELLAVEGLPIQRDPAPERESGRSNEDDCQLENAHGSSLNHHTTLAKRGRDSHECCRSLSSDKEKAVLLTEH